MIGKLGTYNQLAQTVSIVFAYVLGYVVVNDAGDEVRWRIYLGFPALVLSLRIWSLWGRYRFETLERHIQKG